MDSKYLKLLSEYDLHCAGIQKATVIEVKENIGDKERRIKKTEKKYITWFEYYFPHYAKVPCADFHKNLSDALINDSQCLLLAEVFRSGAKSTHLDMGVALYCYFVLNDLRFMVLIGETELKAKKLLSDIQAELMYNQRLTNDYGSRYKLGDWADGNFFTSDGARFMALGFGQSPRGLREGHQRPDYIAIDDVDTKKHVNNDKIMRESVEYITEEVMGCFDAADGATARLVYSNNNFHKNSITNRLKAQFNHYIAIDKQEGQKTHYKIITVTAVKDMIDFEPTWPQKTTSKYWRNKYLKNPRAFMREFMHIHVSTGKVYKQENMLHKKMLPLKDYDALIFIGDLSYKDKGDFKGMYLIGKKGKEYHIIHSFLRQTSRTEVAAWLYDMYEKRSLAKHNVDYKIDGLFAQDEFTSDFDTEGDSRGYYIPVMANKKSYGNKFDFIESKQGYFLRKWVWFNIDEKELPDQVVTIDQFLDFEKGSQAHDDGPDAVCVGMSELDKITFVEKFEPRITKRQPSKKRY